MINNNNSEIYRPTEIHKNTGLNNATYADLQFKEAIRAAGFTPPDNVHADGKIHRFSPNGRRGDDAGWYVFFSGDIPAGAFGDWRTGYSQNWRADVGKKLTHIEKKAFCDRVIALKNKRTAEEVERRENARWKARRLWNQAVLVIHHPYLKTKKIKPHGAKVFNGALIVPIFNKWDRLVNLQFIHPDGTKRFLSGGQKKGCFHIIGDVSDTILICEGFATGASIYEHSGKRVVVAFDAGNLLPVAKNIRKSLPDRKIIICGDNDKSGIGQAKANDAALAVSGKLMIPPVEGMDWNDYLVGDAR